MTHGYAGQHVLLHVDRGVRHAATEAGGAEAAALAGESYELRMAAAAANEVQASCGQEPAAQILLELAHHELREAAVLGEVFQHLRPMGLDGLVEHAFFGPSARVAVPANGRVQSAMGVRRMGHSQAPWLDVCRRWRSAISGIWARSGWPNWRTGWPWPAASGQKQTSLRASPEANSSTMPKNKSWSRATLSSTSPS